MRPRETAFIWSYTNEVSKLVSIRQITLDPNNHTYQVLADTHCLNAIPPTGSLGVKRMLEGKLLFNIWPVWYNPVDITAPDA